MQEKTTRDYAAAIVMAVCFTVGSVIGNAAPVPPHPASAAAAVTAFGLAMVSPTSFAVGAWGLACGLLSSWTPPLWRSSPWPPSLVGVFDGPVVSRSEDPWGRAQVLVNARPGLGGDPVSPFPVLLSVAGGRTPEPGETIRFCSRLRRKQSQDAAGPLYLGTVKAGGWTKIEVRGAAGLIRGVRRRISLATSRAGPAAGVYRSLLLGDRSRIPWDCMRAFRRTGTSHLLAISGLNLVAAVALGSFFGFPATALLSRRCRPLLSLAVRLVFGLAAAGAYLALCGLSSSASRALVWAILAGFAPVLGRRGEPLVGAAICLVALGLLSARPQPDLSLTLSLLAFVAVVRCLHRGDGVLKGAVRVTLGACLYTAPVTVWVFGTVPILALPFNLAAGLPFSLVLIPGALLGGLAAIVHQGAGDWLLTAWEAAAGPVLALLAWGADVPGACLSLNAAGRWAGALAFLASAIAWEKRGRALRLGLVLWIFAAGTAWSFGAAQRAFEANRLSVDFPALGQADAAIIRAGNVTVLVDCGPPGPLWREPPILAALGREGITSLDLLVLTHEHPDHAGGAEGVLRALDVRRVLVPRGEIDPAARRERVRHGTADDRWQEAADGDVQTLGDLVLRVRHPPAAGPWGCGNEGSLVVEASWRGRTVLLAGDAPWKAVGRALDEGGEPDVFKIPHHGSGLGFDAAAWPRTLRRLAARGTVAVCTAHPSGSPLPSDEVREAFSRCGIDLRFPENGNGMRFKFRERS